MTENGPVAPSPRRVEDHVAAAASPERHLLEAHKLSIQVQGKAGGPQSAAERGKA